ncbi:MAG: HAD family hydrolase [Sedimentisphaerales bacterium]|nr:HAD family hydrolase [Sedimentisphaerales bacterium]
MAAGKNKRAAIFLDRDGTIIEDRGHLSDPSDVIFFPETFAALKKLQKYFLLFIVTNQPGVADGIINREDVDKINAIVIDVLAKAGIEITDTYVCPHERSEKCDCIKPKPYFLKQAESRYNLDISKSFTIGDHPHDVEFGQNAGAGSIYLLTGHGRKHLSQLPENTEIAEGIMQAAEKVISLCQIE